MKYVITDKGEVMIGDTWHREIAEGLSGRVVAAGHYRKVQDGSGRERVETFGESIGFRIAAKPEDAAKIEEYLASGRAGVSGGLRI